jgi:hypothetical protein
MSKPFDMALLPDSDKEELCRSLLSEFGVTSVKVTGSGEMIHSCCLPFGGHSNGDANPSASLNYKKLTYNCLGCGSSGGFLWFIGVCRGASSKESRRWLKSFNDTEGDDESFGRLLAYFDALYADPEKPTPIPRFDTRVLDPWMFVHPYLTEMRHIPLDTITRFRVGWNPVEDRIVIPHFWRGDLVGWQTRQLIQGSGPKYRSTADFPKDQTVFNHEPGVPIVVVESPMSVLSKHHVEPRIVATFGASVTERQAKLLAYHPVVTVWMDNDKAGWEATEKLGERLLPYCDVNVVESSWAADPADVDDDTFVKLLRSAVPYAVWERPHELLPWEVSHEEVRDGEDPA